MNNLKQLRGRIIALNNHAFRNLPNFGSEFECAFTDEVKQSGATILNFAHYSSDAIFAVLTTNGKWLDFELKNGSICLFDGTGGHSKQQIKKAKESLEKQLKKFDIDKFENRWLNE